jgi:ABC-type bacteriocin/lantibiotic exporter with double-glycine peptidase domain
VLSRSLRREEGPLWLQGRPAADFPLRSWRQQVQVFPQDSFVFSGPLRSFLDPRGRHPDAALTTLLARLASAATTRDGGGAAAGLEVHVAAGGANLSAGQRQVAVLARAALAEAAVVILDEVTSHMDEGVAARSLTILKEELTRRGAAVLLVSHRSADLAACDEEWRMDAGRILPAATEEEA